MEVKIYQTNNTQRENGEMMAKEEELREQLYKICDETKTSRSGMDYLVNYYQENLGWSEKAALEYAILLFHNGTIQQIKLINKDGEELWIKHL